jgi:hypothetical protein
VDELARLFFLDFRFPLAMLVSMLDSRTWSLEMSIAAEKPASF